MDSKKLSTDTKEKIKDYAIGIGIATIVTGNPVAGALGGAVGTAVMRKLMGEKK